MIAASVVGVWRFANDWRWPFNDVDGDANG